MPENELEREIGLGGGCHWCTEAVFTSLKGVSEVKSGFVASDPPNADFSEAVIVKFSPSAISLRDIISIHLETHSADSDHSMRNKYRSAVYCFSEKDQEKAEQILLDFQRNFENRLVTKALPFRSFRPVAPEYRNYYCQNPEKPFCQTYISPKLDMLKERFGEKLK